MHHYFLCPSFLKLHPELFSISTFLATLKNGHPNLLSMAFGKLGMIENMCFLFACWCLYFNSSSVNVTLANGLIDQRDIKPDQIQKLVTLLESILIRRNQFLERFKENHRPEPQLKDVRFQGSTKLEVALLIHLSSAEPDICSKVCYTLLFNCRKCIH